jgi:hypothetical protein
MMEKIAISQNDLETNIHKVFNYIFMKQNRKVEEEEDEQEEL